MAYVGRSTDKISNIEKLDTIVFDGSSSYTLQKNSVNFLPNSANSLQVSIDGVVQAGNFTVSGSTIDFGVAIPSTSTNDFIFHYGTGLITTPADGTVGLAQLSATGTKDATTFLRGDNTFATPTDNGKVLQVVQTIKTDAFATSGTNSFEDVTGISVNITPTSASNKIFIMVNLGIVSTNGANAAHFRLLRDATVVGVGDSAGSRISSNATSFTETNDAQTVNFNLLDSPSTTSQITYKIQIYPNNTSYINRLYIDGDNDQYGRSSSTITVMEIGA